VLQRWCKPNQYPPEGRTARGTLWVVTLLALSLQVAMASRFGGFQLEQLEQACTVAAQCRDFVLG
jgi:hypothetical protein